MYWKLVKRYQRNFGKFILKSEKKLVKLITPIIKLYRHQGYRNNYLSRPPKIILLIISSIRNLPKIDFFSFKKSSSMRDSLHDHGLGCLIFHKLNKEKLFY
ncbi:hypothetical protein RclHR1_05940004 [Rhizophagus clarus]|uniref:Uncharacterized protein n=1 Tax=Rhizophagus clarus TaxID=94130 RepID=A0A2Z6RVM8_9GLOM|nr:hypothetical protein RclHR1_05940004 [Rhizophagus clarus]